MKQQYLTTVEKIRGRLSQPGFLSLPKNMILSVCCVSLHGRGHAALPAGEPGASGGDDPHRGPEGAAGHGQEDAALLPDVPAGAAGGRREEHRARGHTCPKTSVLSPPHAI